MTQLFYERGFKIKLYENCDIFFFYFFINYNDEM